MRLRLVYSISIAALIALGAGLLGSGARAGAFPGLNGKIAFTSNENGAEVFAINPDGTGEDNLTDNGGSLNDSQAAWSADGAHLAFAQQAVDSSPLGFSPDVWKMNADGSAQTQLTTNQAVDIDPAWSPTGAKIVFSSNRSDEESQGGGDYDLYTMNADGSDQTQLTSTGADDRQPAWSPDGTKIAFIRDFGKGTSILTMNADGGGELELTGNNISPNFGSLSWSPNATRIAFTSDRDEDADIYTMRASDGGDVVQLTFNSWSDLSPAYAPDGTKIAFASLPGSSGPEGQSHQIWTMNAADGSGLFQVTNRQTGADDPDWQPVAPPPPPPPPPPPSAATPTTTSASTSSTSTSTSTSAASAGSARRSLRGAEGRRPVARRCPGCYPPGQLQGRGDQAGPLDPGERPGPRPEPPRRGETASRHARQSRRERGPPVPAASVHRVAVSPEDDLRPRDPRVCVRNSARREHSALIP